MVTARAKGEPEGDVPDDSAEELQHQSEETEEDQNLTQLLPSPQPRRPTGYISYAKGLGGSSSTREG